jgi:hypothetical protein
LAGVDLPRDRPLDGTSLAPLFAGKPLNRQQPLFWHYYNALGEPKLATREGDWMIVATVDSGRGGKGGGFRPSKMPLVKDAQPKDFELYNLAQDLSQRTNVAAQSPDRVGAMSGQLCQLWKQVQAEGPDWRNRRAVRGSLTPHRLGPKVSLTASPTGCAGYGECPNFIAIAKRARRCSLLKKSHYLPDAGWQHVQPTQSFVHTNHFFSRLRWRCG